MFGARRENTRRSCLRAITLYMCSYPELYFESAHGTAPDIAGKNIINPTATVLSAAMLLEYLGEDEAAGLIKGAVAAVYTNQENLTADQGGRASTSEFFNALQAKLQGALTNN